jgi:hypothetical protein
MTLRGNDSDREPMAMAHPQELRELTYELLRKIEHKLGGLSDIDDAAIASTVTDCERVLAEIRAELKSI